MNILIGHLRLNKTRNTESESHMIGAFADLWFRFCTSGLVSETQ